MSKGETGSSHITHSSAPWTPNNPLCEHLTFLLATQHPKPFLCLGSPPPLTTSFGEAKNVRNSVSRNPLQRRSSHVTRAEPIKHSSRPCIISSTSFIFFESHRNSWPWGAL